MFSAVLVLGNSRERDTAFLLKESDSLHELFEILEQAKLYFHSTICMCVSVLHWFQELRFTVVSNVFRVEKLQTRHEAWLAF
jgi:hypothetical protein